MNSFWKDIAVLLVLLGYSAPAVGQLPKTDEDFSRACTDTAAIARFVMESSMYIAQGVDRTRVLDTLVCIGTTGKAEFYAACAVNALCELITSGKELQWLLLRIIESPATSRPVRDHACKAFVYVSDADGQTALRKLVTDKYPNSLGSSESDALLEMGDIDYKMFLDGKLLNASCGGDECKRAASASFRIQLQKNPTALMEHLKDGSPDIPAVWLLRQGVRNGATGLEAQDALRSWLRAQKHRSTDFYELVAAAREAGILTDQNIHEFPEAQLVYQRIRKQHNEGACPPGSKRFQELKNEFYHFQEGVD